MRKSLLLPLLLLFTAGYLQAQVPIPCGAPPLVETYCYGPNEQVAWSYETGGTGTLRLVFIQGTIQSATFDQLTIYDGSDSGAPVAFEHTQTAAYNLGPQGSAINNTFTNFHAVDIISTSGQFFMVLESNATTHCGSPTTYDAWEWNVFCYDCVAPQVTAVVDEDCDLGIFNLVVNVASTGDGPTVTLRHSLNGGAPVISTGVNAGTTTLGPFPIGGVVNLDVQHASDELCNYSLGEFTDSGVCPVHVLCGGPAIPQTYCYGPNENTAWLYEADGEGTLRLLFERGTIQSATFDRVRIYDGDNVDAPLLFAHTATAAWNLGPPGSAVNNTFVNFHAVDVSATSGMILMVLESNATTHCGTTATYDPWIWQVMCLDCIGPSAELNVLQDCDQFQYQLEVDVTSLGSAQEVTIASVMGSAPVLVSAPGIHTIGPFESGVPVQVVVHHDANNLCDLVMPEIVNPVCPTFVCGPAPVENIYCYGPNENTEWAWAAPGNGQLRLIFQKGTIQTSSSDQLIIYDGPDPSYPILFQHTNTAASNLGPQGSSVNNTFAANYGVDITSTNTNIYMVLTSNATVHCGTTTTYDPWEWTVQCIGCEAPGMTFDLIENCEYRSFEAAVVVNELTGPEGFQITEVISGQSQMAGIPNTYFFGDRPVNDHVVFAVEDMNIANCVYYSDTLTLAADSCIINTCGLEFFEYCYGNNENRWYTYRSTENVPITLMFLAGHMMPGDQVLIYNGLSEVGTAVLYQGNNQQNLSYVAFNSVNTMNALTLRIMSNPAASCADGAATVPLRWQVDCGAVGMEEYEAGGFSLYPNPASDILTVTTNEPLRERTIVRLVDMSGRVLLEERSGNTGSDRLELNVANIQNGQYLIQMVSDQTTATRVFQIIR
jgi:hypothetical protein